MFVRYSVFLETHIDGILNVHNIYWRIVSFINFVFFHIGDCYLLMFPVTLNNYV